MEKEAYYFPHFSNARNDRKIKRMKKDLGFLGYAVYFMILEILRDQPELKYPISDLDLLLDEFQIDSADLNRIINDYELFNFDDEGNFYSPKQHEYLQPWFDKKKKRSLAGQKGMASRWQKTQSESGSDNNDITNGLQTDNNVITPLYQCNNTVITKKRKEKKRKEIIEEDVAKNCDPPKNDFFDDIIEAFKSEYLESRKEAYAITAIGKERAAVSRLLKAYKANEVNKGKDTETTLTDFKNFFKSCMEIQEDWIFNNMTLSIISSKLNEIKSYIRSKNANPKPTYKPSGEQSDYQKRRGFDINSVKRSYEERQRDGYSTPLLSIVEDTERTAFN